MKNITVTVSLECEVVVEANGFKGKGCRITEAIEKALGVTGKTKHKPEFNAQELATQKIG